MEEIFGEQPFFEPAIVSDETSDFAAEVQEGSLPEGQISEENLGKFKSVDSLLQAYNNLEAEFTKKCQRLSEIEKDKSEEPAPINLQDLEAEFDNFLNLNTDAGEYASDILEMVKSDSELAKSARPFDNAWQKIIVSHVIGGQNKANDAIVDKYVLSDENVRDKVIQMYLDKLKQQKTPVVISSEGGQRVSEYVSDTPSNLIEAKKLMEKMFY